MRLSKLHQLILISVFFVPGPKKNMAQNIARFFAPSSVSEDFRNKSRGKKGGFRRIVRHIR